MGALVEVEHLTVATADGRALVRDLNLRLVDGERVAMIGESGSGKSMTSLAIMGLLPEELTASGSIRLAGQEMIGTSDRDRRRVRGSRAAIVFQEPLEALDPLASVEKQLGEILSRAAAGRGARLGRRERRSAVRSALADVSLREIDRIARAYRHQISGGQRQRVAIAMALAADPDVLILDEPTTALDVTVQAEILDLIKSLVAGRDTSILFISHDLAVVSEMADRALVLRLGDTVESGPIADIVMRPQHPYTRDLVAAARELDAALDAGGPR